jgi:hypothetical protein
MKPKLASSQRGDSGLLDLIAILAAVAIVGMVGYAYLMRRQIPASRRINCVYHLMMNGLAFRLWAQDNNDKMPGQVSTNAGGVMELVSRGSVIPFFTVMSNELGIPNMLVCPADPRQTGTNWSGLTDTNVSYFVVPEADETMPQMWLCGDRNLATNRVALAPGLFGVPTNRVFSWTSQLHNDQGNVALSDGSVQQFASTKLNPSVRAHFAATNVPFRLIIP